MQLITSQMNAAYYFPNDFLGYFILEMLVIVCRGEERLVKTCLYMWEGFIAKNSGWSPIRELATPTDSYTRSVSAV